MFVIIDQDFAGAAVREVEQKPIQLDKGRTLQAKSTELIMKRNSRRVIHQIVLVIQRHHGV